MKNYIYISGGRRCGMDQKARRHVVAYGHTTWQRIGVHMCVSVCAHVCVRACVHACEERDKASFS